MAFAGGEGEQENKPISISVVTTYPEGDESYVTVMAFKNKVEELGQGQIEVKVFHSGSMGGEKDIVQAVKPDSAQVVTCVPWKSMKEVSVSWRRTCPSTSPKMLRA